MSPVMISGVTCTVEEKGRDECRGLVTSGGQQSRAPPGSFGVVTFAVSAAVEVDPAVEVILGGRGIAGSHRNGASKAVTRESPGSITRGPTITPTTRPLFESMFD